MVGGGQDGFRMSQAHYIYCEPYFYHDGISSTWDHPALEPEGRELPAVENAFPSDSVKMFVFVNRKTEMPPYLVPLEYGGSWESLSEWAKEDSRSQSPEQGLRLGWGSRGVGNLGASWQNWLIWLLSLSDTWVAQRAFSFFLQCSGSVGPFSHTSGRMQCGFHGVEWWNWAIKTPACYKYIHSAF